MMGIDDDQSVDQQAIQWFVTLRDDDVSAEERRRFDAWLASDPRHLAAWHEIERMWGGLDLLAASPEAAVESSRPDRSSNVVPLETSRSVGRVRTRRFGWRGNVAAAAILFVMAMGWQMAPAGLMADYRSGAGERRTVFLDDGSQVELGTGSAMDVAFGDDVRTVTLLAGEAFFTVAKDPARPFVVSAGRGEITVLGTAFNVRVEESTTVAVAQNVVAVSAADDLGVRVGEGEMVRFGPEGVSAVEPADLDAIAAWRSDQIVFRDVPLDEVVSELQRYRLGRIQLVGDDIGKRRVTAVFDTRRVDAALDTIAQNLGLRIVRVAGLFTAIMPG